MNDIIQKIIEAIDTISYKQPSNNSSNNSSAPANSNNDISSSDDKEDDNTTSSNISNNNQKLSFQDIAPTDKVSLEKKIFKVNNRITDYVCEDIIQAHEGGNN